MKTKYIKCQHCGWADIRHAFEFPHGLACPECESMIVEHTTGDYELSIGKLFNTLRNVIVRIRERFRIKIIPRYPTSKEETK